MKTKFYSLNLSICIVFISFLSLLLYSDSKCIPIIDKCQIITVGLIFLALLFLTLLLVRFKAYKKISKILFIKEHKSKIVVKNEYLNELINDLKFATKKHRITGLFLSMLLVSVILSLTIIINFNFIPNQAGKIIGLLFLNRNPFLLVVYYLGRAIIFGTFFSASIFFIFKLAKGSLDQSVRYRKRLDSLYFLNYVLDSGKFKCDRLEFKNIDDIVNLYEVWLKSIDSAFTDNDKYNDKSKFSFGNKDNNFTSSTSSNKE